ncbi:MAG TPA: LytR C-terminal domain-containing protein [Gaiellaceae bacterium]
MEQAQDLIRPWRRATIAVSAVAAVELLLLTIVGIALFGKPLLHHFQSSAASAATPPRHVAKAAPAKAVLPRSEVEVMVLNGNGQAGAAHAAADRVQAKGYLLGNVGNAPRIMPHSLVMFRPGYAGEARRLARDLHVRIVRPLDGMRPSQLLGAHLVLILGT